ncbi:MAG: hypothetical protein NVSMB38_23800 [Ktedonobacteraceae bacterium]
MLQGKVMSHSENRDILVSKVVKHEERQNAVKNGTNRKSKSKDSEEIEKKLRESEERYRSLVSATSQIVWITDASGKRAGDLAAWCAYTGQSAEEANGSTIFSAIHPDDRERVAQAWHYAVANNLLYEAEYRLRRYDGVYRLFAVKGVPVFELDGAIREWVGACTDITERKKLEEARDRIAQQEQAIRQQAYQAEFSAATHVNQLETVFASIVDGVFVYDLTGNILQVNAAMRELLALDKSPTYFNLTPTERLQLLDTRDEQGNVVLEEMQPMMRILRGEVLNGATATDATLRALNGRLLQINVSGAPLRDQQGNITGGVMVVRDVTDRRRLERRTQTSLEGLLKMAEALVQLPTYSEDKKDGMSAIGRRLAELTCNILDCERVGLFVIEPETDILRPFSVVGLSPEQEDAWWQEQEQQTSMLNMMSPEAVARLRANEVLVLNMTQAPLNAMPNPYNVKVMLLAPMCLGDQLVGLLMLDYGSIEHVYTQSEIALTNTVATLSALVIERQRLLVEQTEARGREVALQEANRRMEEFLGIVSHELRTPLTTIKANVQLAKRRLKAVVADPLSDSTARKVDAAQDMLSRAEYQIGVLNRLVGDLIDISRIQTRKLQLHLRKELSDLFQIISEAVQEQQKAFPNRTITLSSSIESLPVVADSDRIVQVLVNYLSNALKYSTLDKPVEVRLMREKDRQGADIARLSVRDEGPGLLPEEQKRIWECFYQSEQVKVVSGSGVGLGLGLYISQSIIERHQGHIGVDSTPGVGSTFWFTLPLVQNNTISDKEE